MVSVLRKITMYPRPHDLFHTWFMGLETGVANQETIYPIVMNDEGLGAPDSYTANPENAAFVVSGGPNCFVESRVNNIVCEIIISLTKAAIETDKLPAVRMSYMPIFTAFLENLVAIDELSSLEVQDVLELTSESTDRQAYPLYNDIKMVERGSGTATLDAAMPGLTASQVLEGVAFSSAIYYDAIHYYTIAGKLKKSQGGLRWFTLTQQNPVKRIRIRFSSKAKRMNPYTFFGVLLNLPKAGDGNQLPIATDTTNVQQISVMMRCRYNEWNENFDFSKV